MRSSYWTSSVVVELARRREGEQHAEREVPLVTRRLSRSGPDLNDSTERTIEQFERARFRDWHFGGHAARVARKGSSVEFRSGVVPLGRRSVHAAAPAARAPTAPLRDGCATLAPVTTTRRSASTRGWGKSGHNPAARLTGAGGRSVVASQDRSGLAAL
jgi:hypothetical protein